MTLNACKVYYGLAYIIRFGYNNRSCTQRYERRKPEEESDDSSYNMWPINSLKHIPELGKMSRSGTSLSPDANCQRISATQENENREGRHISFGGLHICRRLPSLLKFQLVLTS
ncbi:hypothetical protein ACMFMF_009004 [Clarireedia jacksonii]